MALLNDRFDINHEEPLPAFDGISARAYKAKGRGSQASVDVIALVCSPNTPVRADLINSQRGLTHAGMMRVREGGVVDWPLSGQKQYAFIYDTPKGQRLAPHGSDSFTPIKEDTVLTRIAPALCGALGEMARSGITHGCIRSTNVYIAPDGASVGAFLGDNLSQLPGIGQGAVFDTIERALAPELGRGAGGSSDDYYSLGVTLLTALTGEIPLQQLDAAAIVQMKMERGSYAALVGERRFPAAIVELLRGFLTDDVRERWGDEDVGMWLSGRRLTPKPTYTARKASRAIRFGSTEVTQMRQLMQVFPRDTRLAATMIRNDELERWISNGFSDDTMIKYLDEAKDATRVQRVGPEDERLVTNVMCALDPGGPIRYRGVSVFPAGIPALYADMLAREGNVQILNELIQNDVPTTWLEYQSEKRPDTIAAVQFAEKAKQYLQGTGLGFGAERALYEMNAQQPCLSPLVAGRYVLNIKQLIEALERRAGQGPMSLMDRHLGGFLLARDRKVLPQMLASIDQTNDVLRRNVALLTLYSELQYRNGPDVLKGLAGALLPLTEEATKRFHNRPRQEKIRKDLRAAANEGALAKMLKLVDDPAALEEDRQQFEAARVYFTATEDEVQRLSLYSSNRRALAQGAGQPLAAVIAVFMAFVLLVMIIIRMFM